MLYLDTSAFIKLAIDEPFHAEMRELVRTSGRVVSSRLLRLEARRAVLRGASAHAEQAHEALARLSLVPMSEAILEFAESVGSESLRSLDAIHLATALSVRDEIQAFVTYDRQLGRHAEQSGLTVLAPGVL